MGDGPALAVVLVCHHSAEELPATLAALGPQLRDDDELVVVDNASTDGTADVALRHSPRAIVVRSAVNRGFAGGCHEGALASSAPLLLFLNPDAVLEDGCLDALRTCALERPPWGAWQALVALDDGRRVNSAGNPVHYLGFAWAGGLERSVDEVDAEPHEVASASGAALVVRREAWEAVGGFDERYFMYGEDLDLSLRLRATGWGVGIVPAARVRHDYAFAKGDYKWFHLERNRWWTVLGAYPGRLLALLAPALLAFEVVVLAAAWRGGWLRAKLRAQGAVLRELPAILRRRRRVQEVRTLDDARFAAVLTDALDSPHLASAARIPGAVGLQRAYFSAVRAVLR